MPGIYACMHNTTDLYYMTTCMYEAVHCLIDPGASAVLSQTCQVTVAAAVA